MTRPALAATAIASLLLAACGGTLAAQASPSPGGGTAPQGGDIPDTQVYLRYQGAGFAIEYPEGWQQTATASSVVFQDKDNRISASIRTGAEPTTAQVTADVAAGGFKVTGAPAPMQFAAGQAVKVSYQAQGQPDPVTGKRPTLAVDRYYVAGAGRYAVLELAAPVGVDNVDAYKRIAESFRWQ